MNSKIKPHHVALFGLRLDQWLVAYKAACGKAEADRQALDLKWAEFQAKVEAGEASYQEEDEDGHVVFDHGSEAGERMQELGTVLELVRQAFLIALNHLWERHLNRMMSVSGYDEEKVFSFLEDSGAKVARETLTALRYAANVAKHSGGRSADALYKLRPDLFSDDIASLDGRPTYEDLSVSAEHLTEFYEAVRSSGPRQYLPGYARPLQVSS